MRAMNREHGRAYALDAVAGPFYRTERVTEAEAETQAKGRECPHVINFAVWPYPESAGVGPELRAYYALNLPQAVARAVEVEVRLREQGLRAELSAVRPASADETELFFRAMEALEQRMPEPVPEAVLAALPLHLGPGLPP